jgi:OmpA-OmpF porin, OOP family
MTQQIRWTARQLGLVSLTGIVSLWALPAAALEGSFGYGGLSVGRSDGRFGTESQVIGGLSPGAALSSFSRDTRDTGFKVFGGYQFNRNFALEGGYFVLGKLGYSATTTPAGTVDAQFKLNGANLDLLGKLPLSDNWTALARVGVAAGRSRVTYVTTGPVALADTSKRNTNPKLGLGLEVAVGTGMLVRGEVERYRMNDALGAHVNVNLVSVGLVFPFGASPAPAPRAAAPISYVAPPQVMAPPPPPPVLVQAEPVVVPMPAPVAPLPPPRRRVTFSAESLFNFDSAEVNATGKTALDKFAGELDGTQFEMVVVEGHTDRLGTADYNQKLSLKRAESVKSYLVTSGHIDPMKISAAGKGETSPTTQAADCVGTRASAQLIICLRPDRRVDVDVVGTR